MTPDSIVFLVDVDETLMDTEQFDRDLAEHLEQQVSLSCRFRCGELNAELFTTLGYRDHLGTIQRYRVENPYERQLLPVASFILEYPFADRLFPGSLDLLQKFRAWGKTVILTDGDMVLQPRKLERSGLTKAVDGHALIFIHKELALREIERLYPATHYVLVDDKLRILTAFKNAWRNRVTTIFPRQGKFANDPDVLANYPSADLAIDRIGDLLQYELPALLAGAKAASMPKSL